MKTNKSENIKSKVADIVDKYNRKFNNNWYDADNMQRHQRTSIICIENGDEEALAKLNSIDLSGYDLSDKLVEFKIRNIYLAQKWKKSWFNPVIRNTHNETFIRVTVSKTEIKDGLHKLKDKELEEFVDLKPEQSDPEQIYPENIGDGEIITNVLQVKVFSKKSRKNWMNYVAKNCSDEDSFLWVISNGFGLVGLNNHDEDKNDNYDNNQIIDAPSKILENQSYKDLLTLFVEKVITYNLITVLMVLLDYDDYYEFKKLCFELALKHKSIKSLIYITRLLESNKYQAVDIFNEQLKNKKFEELKFYFNNIWYNIKHDERFINELIDSDKDFEDMLLKQGTCSISYFIEYYTENKKWDRLKEFVNKHL
tara:strand:- start:1811 stop:2911 length:1101 start_codon:yes stop_codon:yes gene_type:complete